MPSLSKKFSTLSTQFGTLLININEGDGTLSKLIEDEELYNNSNFLVLETTNLITETKTEIDAITEKINLAVDDVSGMLEKLNKLLDPKTKEDKNIQKDLIKNFLKAQKEFKKEEKDAK